MWSNIYKKLVIDFSKFSIILVLGAVIFSLYQAKNFNLDASSDALLLEGDKDLKYLREINERYKTKDFLVLTYTPVASFVEKETILNLQLLKSKIEKLSWVENVITIIEWPEKMKKKTVNRLEISFYYESDAENRKINLKGFGKWKNFKLNAI